MKSILVLALLSVVLVGFVGYADAYEGKINVTVGIQNEDYYRGDSIPMNGMLGN